uniref:DNA-(apurinic or apyrimidinic site) endonuclease n=1 Tax=Hordeum vulgare subsp. vulgare TaxID=112509 RepID=A0A8I7B3Q6_HORVV
MNRQIKIASWNVRGLGRENKCTDVKQCLQSATTSILCLQETKLELISVFKASSFLPPGFRSFHFLPSNGASGGLLTAWDDTYLQCTRVHLGLLLSLAGSLSLPMVRSLS